MARVFKDTLTLSRLVGFSADGTSLQWHTQRWTPQMSSVSAKQTSLTSLMNNKEHQAWSLDLHTQRLRVHFRAFFFLRKHSGFGVYISLSLPFSPHGLSFTWWGCCGLCFWHKSTKLAHSFIFCSCVYFCLHGPFLCISFHKFFRKLSAFSLCSSGLISALLVLPTIYLFRKVSLIPDIILCDWLGLKHQLTD